MKRVLSLCICIAVIFMAFPAMTLIAGAAPVLSLQFSATGEGADAVETYQLVWDNAGAANTEVSIQKGSDTPVSVSAESSPFDLTSYLQDSEGVFYSDVYTVKVTCDGVDSNSVVFHSDFAGGTGEIGDEYKIATLRHLVNIGVDSKDAYLSKHFIQIADIKAGNFKPLVGSTTATSFTGTYTGDSTDMENLRTIDVQMDGSQLYASVFGLLTGNAEISYLRITGDVYNKSGGTGAFACSLTDNAVISHCINEANVHVSSDNFSIQYHVGGIAGAIMGTAKIEDSVNKGTVTTIGGKTATKVGGTGGVVGATSGTPSILRCTNAGAVTVDGTRSAGGIAGTGNNLVITDCSNSGNIETADSHVGGILAVGNSTITGCSNSGNVVAKPTSNYKYAGGILGSGNSVITNCSNTGSVQMDTTNTYSYAAGIAAYGASSITGCFNTGSIHSLQHAAGIASRLNVAGFVKSSYNAGTVTTNGYGAGVVSYLQPTSGIGVEDSYNTGVITGSVSVGGVTSYVGNKSNAVNITRCYNLYTDSGLNPIYTKVESTDNLILTNCYYLKGAKSSTDENVTEMTYPEAQLLATYKTFADNGWEVKALTESNTYPFPQLTSNPHTGAFPVMYKVTVSAGVGGTVTPSGDQYVKSGDTLTVTVAADDDHILEKILYDGIEVSANTEGIYTTPAIEKDAVITVSFKDRPIAPPAVTPLEEVYVPAEKNGNITFGTVVLGYGTTIKEYGIVYSATQSTPEIGVGDAQALKADSTAHPMNSKNQYGIELKGDILSGTSYYTRPYVIYSDAEGDHIQYGDPVFVDLR